MSAHAKLVTMGVIAKAGLPGVAPVSDPDDDSTIVYKRWSDPATWGGSVPQAGDGPGLIGVNANILLDVPNPPNLSLWEIYGNLKIDDTIPVMNIVADGIQVIGPQARFRVGSPAKPYDKKLNITLTGLRPTTSGNKDSAGNLLNIPLVTGPSHVGDISTGNNGNTNDNMGVSRGLINKMGGKILFYGLMPTVFNTALSTNAAKNDNFVILSDSVDFKVGDRILIPPTGYRSAARPTTEHTVTANSNGSNVVMFNPPLSYARWGAMQYPTDGNTDPNGNGISLVQPRTTGTANLSDLSQSYTLYDALTNPKGMRTTVDTPSFIDQRAKVHLMNRHITIQGGVSDGVAVNGNTDSGDAEWRTKGFGAHVMTMDLSSKTVIKGVEFRRVGQRGLQGRYPFHWHMLSYAFGTYEYLGDIPAGNGIFSQNVVRDSEHRALTFHGTCGAVAEDNTIYNCKGHNIFLENGTERRNVINRNSVYQWHLPAAADQVKFSDNRSSGIWYSNLDNYFTNNNFADGDGLSIWNALGVERMSLVDPVITGTGRAKFNSVGGGSRSTTATNRSYVLTCTNATAPATFSVVTSDGTNSTPTITVATGYTLNSCGFSISTPTVAFVVGDTITFNTVCSGGGFGESRGADQHASYIPTLVYDNNTVWCGQFNTNIYSTIGTAVFTDESPYNEYQQSRANKFVSTSDGSVVDFYGGSPKIIKTLFRRTNIHHCYLAYSNRISQPNYDSWTSCDNMIAGFAGATDQGEVNSLLTVFRSLNRDIEVNGDFDAPNGQELLPGCGFAGYHGTLVFKTVTGYNYRGAPVLFDSQGHRYIQAPAVMETFDNYLDPVESYLRNTTWRLWNSLAAYRTPSTIRNAPDYSDDVPGVTNFTNIYSMSGAIYDPTGDWAGTPDAAGGFNLLAHPFIYYGADATKSTNGSHSWWTKRQMFGIIPMACDFGADAFHGASTNADYPAVGPGVGVNIGGSIPGNIDNGYLADGTPCAPVTGWTLTRYDPVTLQPATMPDGSLVPDYLIPSRTMIGGASSSNFYFSTMPSGGMVGIKVSNATAPPQRFNAYLLKFFGFTEYNGDTVTDTVLFRMPWKGTVIPSSVQTGTHMYDPRTGGNPNPYLQTTYPHVTLEKKNTLQEWKDAVIPTNSSQGSYKPGFWYQDSANDCVLVKMGPPISNFVNHSKSKLTVCHCLILA